MKPLPYSVEASAIETFEVACARALLSKRPYQCLRVESPLHANFMACAEAGTVNAAIDRHNVLVITMSNFIVIFSLG